ncbi:unnamed protein product [Lymnaea stagnalis]|uniref:SET domain-containing protein n=1 Tax=Lymnaea stagnalis TaxID=6523 RepID=A0AAV2HLT6_LYMST
MRKKRITNFMSLAIPEDDDFFFCEECNFEYMSECPLHGLVPVEDPKVPPECEKGLDSSYCWKTLPQGLAIKKSKIQGAGLGVVATKFFPARTRFGPYVGKKERNEEVAQESGYSWQIYKDGKPSHVVNGSDPSDSN